MIKKIKRTTVREAEILSLSHDGRGIAIINGKKAFISGALPQEKITYQVTRKHTQYDEGVVHELIDRPSPHREIPPCSYFSSCGGCSLQHMSMDLQMQFKEDALLDQLKHFGKVTPKKIIPPLKVNQFGYRHKARLGVRFVAKKNKVLVGFREKSDSYLTDMNECMILHPSIQKKLN